MMDFADSEEEKECPAQTCGSELSYTQVTARTTTVKLTLSQFIERMRINGGLASSYDKLEDKLYETFVDHDSESVNMRRFIMAISEKGIQYKTDPRLAKLRYNIEIVEHYLMSKISNDDEDTLTIDKDLFKGMIIEEIEVLGKIFKGVRDVCETLLPDLDIINFTT